jgi:arylsulfatase A-like enzyme
MRGNRSRRGLLLRFLSTISAVTLVAGGVSAPVTAAAPASPAAVKAARAPNVILIVADDLGFSDIGAYGGAIPTPNIDALAASGVRYDAAYSTAPICSPSRAGLLSGRAQTRFGFHFNVVQRQDVGMPGSETTIAELARSAHYRTGIVGKWHVGEGEGMHPLEQGFERFYGFLGGATAYYPDGTKGIVGLGTAEDKLITRARFPIMDGQREVKPKGNITDVFTTRAIDFVRANRRQPFFLYLAYNAPHTPLQATESDLKRFAGEGRVVDQLYRATITRLDDNVGRLLRELERLKLADNSIVLFVSDNGCPNYLNGACSNAPFSGFKAFPLDGGTHVPFIVRAPGRIAGGQVNRDAVSTLDVMPTIAEAARVPVPSGSEGHSLFGRGEENRILLWRMGPNYWMRHGRWKLISINRSQTTQDVTEVAGKRRNEMHPIPSGSPDGQWKMLFDLAADPGEKNNLAAAHPEVVAKMEALYAAWDAGNKSPEFPSLRDYRTMINGEKVQLIF